MKQQGVDVKKLPRYCVVCGGEYGPGLKTHCTDKSLVAIKRVGFFKKETLFFTLDGETLSEDDLSRMRETETARAATWKQEQGEESKRRAKLASPERPTFTDAKANLAEAEAGLREAQGATGKGKKALSDWETYASSAWENYVRSGRGAVFEGSAKSKRGLMVFSTYALPSSDYGDPAFNAKVDRLLETYDPEREVVVVSAYEGSELAVGRYSMETLGQSPRECYERRRTAKEEKRDSATLAQEGAASTTPSTHRWTPVRDASQTPSAPASMVFGVKPAGPLASGPSILDWDTLPSELSEISAALEEARAEGPAAIARLALLCLCYRHRKSRAEVTHQGEGRFLQGLSTLWTNLAIQAPRDLESLPGTAIPLRPQVPREPVEGGRPEDAHQELPAQYYASTANRGPSSNARGRDQRRWLQAFLDKGEYGRAWEVLDHLRQTLLDEDWDFYEIMGHWDFHKFRYRLLETVETLQPHADACAEEIYAFLSALLVEGAETIPYLGCFQDDRFCRLVSCIKWFLQRWTDPGEFGQLLNLVWAWRSKWPGLALDVFNRRFDQAIRSIQMRREGDPEWGDNWLGDRAFRLERSLPYEQTWIDKTVEIVRRLFGPKLNPHWDCIPKGMERAFFWALPEGDGLYEFRVILESTSQVIETSAPIYSDYLYPYTWTPGEGSIEVGPVPHEAGSWLVLGDVTTWRPDIGAIPLRSVSRSVLHLVDTPLEERFPGVILAEQDEAGP